jgi:hypothetical protein
MMGFCDDEYLGSIKTGYLKKNQSLMEDPVP